MKDDRIYLLHIRDAIHRIRDYTAAGKAAFLADTKTQDAVVRNLEVIGEAAKSVSEQLKATHESIPWKRVGGMRDKLIHEYFGVNLGIVWEVVEQELPVLEQKLRQILQQLGDKT